MREYEHNGAIVEAVRYNPGWSGDVMHQLTNGGIACAHFRPATETIEIFSYGAEIAISDPRHNFDGADGIIYAGDWVVWHTLWHIDIVPSAVFNAEYAPVNE